MVGLPEQAQERTYPAGQLIAVQLFQELFPQWGRLRYDDFPQRRLSHDEILRTSLKSLPSKQRKEYVDTYLRILDKSLPTNTRLPSLSRSLLESDMTIMGLTSYARIKLEPYDNPIPALGRISCYPRHTPRPQDTRPLTKRDLERIQAVEELEKMGRGLGVCDPHQKVRGPYIKQRVVMPKQETSILRWLARGGEEIAYEPKTRAREQTSEIDLEVDPEENGKK